MIKRFYDDLNHLVKPGKALVIFGPRRVGKTTLLRSYLDQTTLKYRLDSGENYVVADTLGSRDFDRIFQYVGDNELIAIDEAQHIEGIGTGLKIIVDHRPTVRVIATGSSSFDLSRNVGEPLTGRKTTILLYPLSQLELRDELSDYDLRLKLEEYLIFGSYPDVLVASTHEQKEAYLRETVDAYLLKDIFELDNVKSPRFLLDLLTLLAFQVGNEVSLNELAGTLGSNIRTISRYLDLLEKTFVITRLGSYSRNLRTEVRRHSKYYFLDNGIRNAVIRQFNPLQIRNDVGQLWENFIFTERLKKLAYKGIGSSWTSYFWRTYGQQEIDLIEEWGGRLEAYEFKWNEKKMPSAPVEWTAAYPQATFQVITTNNYLDFIA
jgi:predicted AAA+ superfamily ATPase